MLITMKDVLVLYEKLQQQTNIAHVSVIMFCALDIDALCTLKIICKILKSENILYKVYPVSNYRQFKTSVDDALVYNQVRLFLTINLGANFSLASCQIFQKQNTQAEMFVLDNHRPVHPDNILSPKIKVFNEDASSENKCPDPQIFQKYQEIMEYDLQFDSEDEERSPQGRQMQKTKEKLRRQKKTLQQLIENYQSHSFFSLPTSRLAYQLVRDLEKGSNDYLWYAIVGMTSMFLEQKLSKEELDRITQFYQTQSNKHNTGQSKDRGQILKKKGFQFAIMDHWSMFESMMHSNYLFAKMQLWQDRGIKRLNQFIHTIGISLQDAKQLYKYMPVEGQKMLDSSIFTAAEKFGLLEVAYLSFARNLDYSTAFMASDVVHILTSALEAAPQTTLSNADIAQHQVKCFWQAYDLLDGGAQQMARQIQRCKNGLRALMKEARHVMQRDHLITTNSMSIANIRGDSQNRLLFQHPFALIRLAYLLMTMLRQHKKSRSLKPLIANWIGVQTQLCLSVGVSMDHKNSLGSRFYAATQKIGIETMQDNFQANIIFFDKQHLSAFIKQISRS